MYESFGTRLRHQRERKHLTLAAIADQTKIHQPLLDAIEHDDISRWPSGIFRRAFIRAYAEAIGLEPDAIVREFLSRYPDPIEVVSIGATLGSVPSNKEHPPTRFAEIVNTMTDSALGFLRRLLVRGGDAPVEDVPAHAPAAPHSEIPAPASFDLAQASRTLKAVGVIVWAWDPLINALRPSMSYGYSSRVLAQLPNVGRDADNATAAAFRSGKTCGCRRRWRNRRAGRADRLRGRLGRRAGSGTAGRGGEERGDARGRGRRCGAARPGRRAQAPAPGRSL
jgi:transcriptional regulator with XRE-family HTH domain